MKRKDLSVTIALCVSLVVHGVVMIALTQKEIADLTAKLYHAPFDLKQWLAQHPRLPEKPEEPSAIVQLPDPKSEIPEFEELFGERGAKGKGMNASPGERPLRAQEGSQDQAALTPHPGRPDSGTAGDSQASQPDSNAAASASAARQSAEQARAAAAPFGVPLAPLPQEIASGNIKRVSPKVIAVAGKGPEQAGTPTTQKMLTMIERPATRPSGVQLAMVTPVAAAPSPAATPQSSQASSSKSAPSHAASGEAGHQSQSESDPFTDAPVVVWNDGKVEARDGRKVKSVRPKLTDAGRLALMEMETPVIVLGVHIDEKGNVTAVDYVQRSNIPEVDLPHYRCAFDWWFEPSKDKSGNPKPDVLLIPFVWH